MLCRDRRKRGSNVGSEAPQGATGADAGAHARIGQPDRHLDRSPIAEPASLGPTLTAPASYVRRHERPSFSCSCPTRPT